MKSAIDPRLSVVAKRANVRPSHVHHAFAAIKELGDAFEPESFAAFCQLEARHIVAIVDALTALNLMPVTRKTQRKAREAGTKTYLPETWSLPPEWVDIARAVRFWSDDVCETVGAEFHRWHRMNGVGRVDWKATWRNWIERSNRENGRASAPGQSAFESDEAKRAYLATLK